MSPTESPGTQVELHDCRDVIGSGSSIHSIKFSEFHMFDANWKLKFRADWVDYLNTYVVSLRLRHRRNSVDDIWNLDTAVKIQFDEEWLKGGVLFDTNFSHRKREVEITTMDIAVEKVKEPNMQVRMKIIMQVKSAAGIQLRNFLDFSRPLPIFSDTIIKVEGMQFHVNRMILSMASPIFLQTFMDTQDDENNGVEICNVSSHDFRRILNAIYPPHMPPKQWIKAKALQISIVFEVADKWLVKYGRFKLEDSLLLAQTFGLRELMGSKLAKIESIDELRKRRGEISSLSHKTKSLILDHILFSL
ncbi:hypothetical protein GCK72_014026 [Caenorhabditis remanei]|uniref:BTB domain-containing protein n=1 Tax=Caenorhabditis remanei TaxID=31234 RepID=A0A6A5GQ96_CAERE|nr:hypothetical protein GCK72_014026 [Caenorhabditis remanei]KAF1757570.1 hypothetical protein GCK72_014026 [Caenorhabditis remanei]